MKKEKNMSLKTLTKSSVWEIQENDVFRLWEAAEKDTDLKDNQRRYVDVIRSAFEIEEIKIDKPIVIDKYIQRGFKIGNFRIDDMNVKYAIKKRPILRVTDLTYENIRHISATKLIEVLERNFGGGWESLPQSIQDIIQSGFDISTTTSLRIVFTSQVVSTRRKWMMASKCWKFLREPGPRLFLPRRNLRLRKYA